LAFSGLLFAQRADRAIITGLVSDPVGAAVPGATVTIIDEGTQVKTVVSTSSDGNYYTPPVILGTYTVQVEKSGFKLFVRRGILLTGGITYRQDATLGLGAVSQTIEVKASSAIVNVETAEVTHVVNQRYYADLPVIMGSDVRLAESQLAMEPGYLPLQPIGDATVGRSAFASRINGGLAFASENYIDGASFGNPMDHNETMERQPPYESIQEVRVIDSTFSAQYGRTSGGFIEYTTKSGTDTLHGALYEYNNVNAENARGELGPFTPHAVTNASGFTLGGPVVIPKLYNGRNKTFFFAALDLTEARHGNIPSYGYTVATPQDMQGDFSARLGANPANPTQVGTDALGRPIYSGEIFNPSTTRLVNGVPVRDGYGFDPTTGLPINGAANIIPPTDPLRSSISAKILPELPTPDRPGITYNGIVPATTQHFNAKNGLIRVDHELWPNFKMTTTFYHTTRPREICYSNVGCSGDPATSWSTSSWQDIRVSLLHQQFEWAIHPNLFNHTTVSFDRWIMPYTPFAKAGGWLAKLGIKGLVDDSGGPPYLNFSDPNIPYESLGQGMRNTIQITNRWQVLDDLSWVKGRHTLKTGFEWRHNWAPMINNGNVTGTWNFSSNETAGFGPNGVINTATGDAFAGLILGQVDNANFTNAPPLAYIDYYVSPWVNDEIKATRNLTLNLGLRWDYESGVGEQFNRTTTFSPTALNPGAGNLPGALVFGGKCNGCNGHQGPWEVPARDDWGPRFGFAYRITDKTSARGGYGIYYTGLTIAPFTGTNAGFSATPTAPNLTGGVQPSFWWDNGFPQQYVYSPPVADPTIDNYTSPYYANRDSRTLPRYQNWSFTVEHELTPNTLFSVAYIGNHGTRLPELGTGNMLGRAGNLNDPSVLKYGASLLLQTDFTDPAVVAAGIKQPYAGFSGDVAQALRPYPQYQEILYNNAPIGTSHYHAAQVRLERRFSHDAMFRIAYINSKFINNGADSNWWFTSAAQNPLLGGKDARSLDSDDVPQTLILAYSVGLPFGPGKHFANVGGPVGKVVGGWKLAAIQRYDEGRPISVGMANDMANFLFNGIKYPNRLPAKNCQWEGGHFDPNVDTWMNSDCWADPGPLTFGNASREDPHVRGPHLFNEDLNLIKDTKINEKFTARFEAQFGNAFNRHFWCSPSAFSTFSTAMWGSGTFGVISGQCNQPRQIEFGLRLDY
jgi:hypothetical protein